MKPSDSTRRGLSRRQFLAGTTAAGLAVGMPSLFSACGDDDNAPPRGPREARTLHFDLSFASVSDACLMALNSTSHRAALAVHTADSRREHRTRNPVLQAVPDERLTHYLEDIDLPSDSFQLLWVTGTHAGSGEPALLAACIHVPAALQVAVARAQLARGAPLPPPAKARAYGITTSGQMPDLYPNLDDLITPWDVATALVFHHPEVMNLDPMQGTNILQLIQTAPCAPGNTSCNPALDTLAFRIASLWPARTTPGGWATLVPFTDVDGTPVVDDDTGDPIHLYQIDDEISATVNATARVILANVFNDAQYEGNNWHATEGKTESVTTAPSAQRAARSAAQAAGFAVTGEHPAGTTVHGVNFVDLQVTDQGIRTVEVDIRNRYLRSLSVYVEFGNESGYFAVSDPDEERDSPRAKEVGILFTNDSLLGIPLIGDLVQEQKLIIDFPADASKARLYFGSLGLGGDAFCPEAMWGSILTLGFNIGLPTIFLAAGVISQASEAISAGWRALFQSTRGIARLSDFFIRTARVTVLASVPGLGRGIFGSAGSDNAQALLVGLANGILQFLLNASPALLVWLASKISLGVAKQAFPFIGIGTRILSAAANLSDLLQTVGEVLASPAVFTNTLSLTMTTHVVIEKDPDDFRFPARARKYEVILTYDQASSLAHKMTGAIEAGRVDPIDVPFDGVPSGGMVTIDVVLTTDDDWIVGRSTDASGNPGVVGPIENSLAAAGQITIQIKELLIPLTQDTRYLHTLKLEVQEQHHVWVETTAPSATRANLCQGTEDRLCDSTAITINQRTGMVGYAYEAGGQGIQFCGEPNAGTMHVVQNLFLADNPDRGLKQLPCGFRQPAGIVYDRVGKPDGRHFFVQPAANGFYVQSIVLDDATPFGLLCDSNGQPPGCTPLTWGRFSQALESLAVVPTGYVVGVNRVNHKMEILQLPPAPVQQADAPEAVPFAVQKGGAGTRPGLLLVPVAVAVSGATILVLEDGNKRVQALDVSGNPVLSFANGTSSVFALVDQGADVVYLDLAVEGKGYMYVLSYVNDGLQVEDYRLDIYTPQGNLLARTTGVAAARLAVDTFRNVYTLNYETIAAAARVEPSLSQWAPSTPGQ